MKHQVRSGYGQLSALKDVTRATAAADRSGLEFLKLPEQLRLSGNITETLRLFPQTSEHFLTGSAAEALKGASSSGPTENSLLHSIAGDDVLELIVKLHPRAV